MEYKGFSILKHFGQYKVIVDHFTEVLCNSKEEAMQYCDKHKKR